MLISEIYFEMHPKLNRNDGVAEGWREGWMGDKASKMFTVGST